MTLGEKELARLPEHLQRLFVKLPNHGSDEVLAAFPESNSTRANGNPNNIVRGMDQSPTSYGWGEGRVSHDYRDEGSAARFFYSAKADSHDRLGSRHPTVKPVDLMQYLVRLVTPKGGLVLDPFAGTGTTGEAAIREGMRAILIEREPEYLADIKRRLELVNESSRSRKVESFKARGKIESAGPLFEIVQ